MSQTPTTSSVEDDRRSSDDWDAEAWGRPFEAMPTSATADSLSRRAKPGPTTELPAADPPSEAIASPSELHRVAEQPRSANPNQTDELWTAFEPEGVDPENAHNSEGAEREEPSQEPLQELPPAPADPIDIAPAALAASQPMPVETAHQAAPFGGDASWEQTDESQQALADPSLEREPPAVIDAVVELDILPLDAQSVDPGNRWLQDYGAFRTLAQKTARVGAWQKLAALTGHAVLNANYSTGPTLAALLLDLARIYRDRLADSKRAEQAFEQLRTQEPANAEAVVFLGQVFAQRAEWTKAYELYLEAVEASWDPQERLDWTEQAATLAEQHLEDPNAAVLAWERLWRLGDATDRAARMLAGYYRRSGRWQELGEFLRLRAERLEGAAQIVALRELAEVYLVGVGDPAAAGDVLEKIVEQRPGDPVATLQLARVYLSQENWPALLRMASNSTADQNEREPAAQGLRQFVADALWRAGRQEQAIVVYDRMLASKPNDREATARKRQYLTTHGKPAELVALLVKRADGPDLSDEERSEVLAEAARAAEQHLNDPTTAAELWYRCATLSPTHLAALVALERIHSDANDAPQATRALEGQLSIVRDPRQRIELLRRLGRQYSDHLEDNDAAERCWKEILALDPTDLDVRESLIELHRKRGDYESLNSALMRQIWLTDNDERAQRLARIAAENVDANLSEPARCREAWRRVLDFNPRDETALGRLTQIAESHQAPIDQIAISEQRLRATMVPEQRIDLAMRVAELWLGLDAPRSAVATYERILRWDPLHIAALDRLTEVYCKADQATRAAGALDHANALAQGVELKLALLDRCQQLIPSDALEARYFNARRMLFLGGLRQEVIETLLEIAREEPSLWHEVESIWGHIAAERTQTAERFDAQQRRAEIIEQQLGDAQRAFACLHSGLLAPQQVLDQLERLERLAATTRRHEELLAAVERLTGAEFSETQRRESIARCASICEGKLGNGLRAFQHQRRLLDLSPLDWGPLQELERLAENHQLWRQYDAVLAQLWDLSASDETRNDLLCRRAVVVGQRLEDSAAAFDLLVRRFRIAPANADLLRELTLQADRLGEWDWLLPLLEASQRANDDPKSAAELFATAALYSDKSQDSRHAFLVALEAFVRSPEAEHVAPLETLAEATGLFEILAHGLRMAAADCADSHLKLRMLRHIAALYADKLHEQVHAIDIHRRLLALKPDEIPSLEVVIDYHRDRGEWRDLRDRIQQWLQLLPEASNRVDRLLEIARLSKDRLGEPEAALDAYSRVLSVAPENSEAQEGIRSLAESLDDPQLRLRWLQMELRSASGDRQIELQLEIAALQAEDLGDSQAAIMTLRELVEEAGVGPAFEPLSALLRSTGRSEELVLLLERHAAECTDVAEQLSHLREASEVAYSDLSAEVAIKERLDRSRLKLDPDDETTATRLARLLRDQSRFADLCELLEDRLKREASKDRRPYRLRELARIYQLNLDQPEKAQACWKMLLEDAPEEQAAALLGLARSARDRDDLAEYLALRRRHIALLPAREAGYGLCRLAEICDETPALADQMIGFYRAARAADPQNVPAREALKGIGRRRKSLRPEAALLNEAGERELGAAQRAHRLKMRGDTLLAQGELDQALDNYQRAVAADPDTVEAWDGLASIFYQLGRPADAFRTRRGWYAAFERTRPFAPSQLDEDAERLQILAQSALAAGEDDAYQMLVRRAFDLHPNHVPTALARAQLLVEGHDYAQAEELLSVLLCSRGSQLENQQKGAAHEARGLALEKMGRHADAVDDFREALFADPLRRECLVAMGHAQRALGHFAQAVEHYLRALTVTEDRRERAELYFRIGQLWEDELQAPDEAGSCFEQALSDGLSSPELLMRTLRHYKRCGRLEESLSVVDGLLPTAENPADLAELWQLRGEILADREGGEDQAIEAFDLALSYDPNSEPARDGLVSILERRNEWRQMLQVLEASADSGSAQSAAKTWHKMALIALERLDDHATAETYLQNSVRLAPSLDTLRQLESLYGRRDDRRGERREVLGRLIAFGPPWFEQAIELAKLIDEERQSWTWALLSPLLSVSQIDADLKARVQGMRKAHEKPPLRGVTDAAAATLHPQTVPPLGRVLAELETLVHPLGASQVDDLSDGNAIAVGPQTAFGKAFAALAALQGHVQLPLFRAKDLDRSVRLANRGTETPIVAIRTDVIQQSVHAEVGFLIGYALHFCRPGHRAMAAMTEDQRSILLPALWAATELSGSDNPAANTLRDRICAAVDEETLQRWAEILAPLQVQDPAQLGQAWWSATQAAARRAGLVAGADLRQAFRALGRIETDIPRPTVVSRLSELDAYVAEAAGLNDLVIFAASEAFGELLRDAPIADPS